jgi:hypothetical protein
MGNCNCNGCVYYDGSGECKNDAECWDYELKKESVKTMNTDEALHYLIDNKKAKLRMIINPFGIKVENESICYLGNCSFMLEGNENTIQMPLNIKNDKAEFEVVRELRKMSFGVAYKRLTEMKKPYTDLVSLISGKNYINPIYNFSDEDLEGNWTVEDVYE